MGSLISAPVSALSAMCCVANSAMCACRMATCCCKGGSTEGSWKMAKVGYLFLFAVNIILALCMKFWGGEMHFGIAGMDYGCTGTGGEAVSHCQGTGAVFRISFCLFLFFLTTMVGTKLSGNEFHAGYWGIKIGIYLGALVLSMWIPNTFFFVEGDGGGSAWYMWFARVVSSLFLVLQIVMLIDFGYEWNRSWVAKGYDDYGEVRNKSWLIAILGCAGAMYVTSLVGIILLFVHYDKSGLNNFFTAVTLIAVVALTGMSLFRDKIAGQEGAILPAAVTAVYCVYLNWSALQSNPDSPRAVSADNEDDASTQVVLGLMITTASLVWTSYSASASGAALFGEGEGGEGSSSSADLTAPIYEIEDGKIPAAAAAADESADAPMTEMAERKKAREERRAARKAGKPVPHSAPAGSDAGGSAKAAGESQQRLWFFHFILMTAAVYMAMLLTDWSSGQTNGGKLDTGGVGKTSMWVKILSQWMTIALYVWTLVAPRCMPNREWD